MKLKATGRHYCDHNFVEAPNLYIMFFDNINHMFIHVYVFMYLYSFVFFYKTVTLKFDWKGTNKDVRIEWKSLQLFDIWSEYIKATRFIKTCVYFVVIHVIWRNCLRSQQISWIRTQKNTCFSRTRCLYICI